MIACSWSSTVVAIRDLDIIEVGGAGSLVIEEEAGIAIGHREVGIHCPDGGAVEPDLAMARRRLGGLHLDTVPGVGTQYICVAVHIVTGARTMPEVDVYSLSTCVEIHFPKIIAVDVTPISNRRGACQARDAEVEAGVA